MGKKIIGIGFLLVFCIVSFAQNAQLNHSKYWFYRTRLRNEFMAVGSGAQCGIPLGLNIPASSAYEGEGQDIHFGDGTSHLGNFIAVLATEYALLDKSNQLAANKDAVLHELWWCLKAFERLDLQAEVLYTPKLGSCYGEINGFFCRDDVDKDSIVKHLGMPYIYDRENNIITTNQKGVAYSLYSDAHNAPLSDMDNVGVTSDTKEPFPSDDQMSNLLVGFAFVRKILTGVHFNGDDLGDLASYYTSKIMDYYSSTTWDLEIPNTPKPPKTLDSPYAKHTISKYGGLQSMVMGYALARAGENVFGNHWGKDVLPSGRWSGSTIQAAPDAWNCLNFPVGTLQYTNNYKGSGQVYNNAVSSQLAAVGNSWEYGLIPIAEKVGCINVPCTAVYWDNCRNICIFGRCHNFCGPRFESWDCGQEECAYLWHYDTQLPSCLEGSSIMGSLKTALTDIITPFDNFGIVPFPLPKLSVNTTGMALGQYGPRTNTQIFSLEHKYLHDATQYYKTDAMVYFLNSAPCTGPHYQPTHDPHNSSLDVGSVGWRTDNRFEKSNPQFQTDKGGWNGIDYMLLHNLYYLVHGTDDEKNGFFNEMNLVLNNVSYPRTATPKGSASSPLRVNGFETLTASNTVANSGAQVKFHAGKKIFLKPGFKAKQGANFKANVQYVFPCTATNGYWDGSTYPGPGNKIDDVPLDSAAFMNSLTSYLSSKKTSADSLATVVNTQKAASQGSQYVPLTQFVSSNVQSEPVSQSKILSVYPNPVNKGGNSVYFNIRFFLKSAQTVQIYLINSMGSLHSSTITMNEPQGESMMVVQFDYTSPLPSGPYSLVMQGSGFSSKYIISIP